MSLQATVGMRMSVMMARTKIGWTAPTPAHLTMVMTTAPALNAAQQAV